MTALRQPSCEDKLRQCKSTTLETTRIRADQIEVFKTVQGFEGIGKGYSVRRQTSLDELTQ